MNRSLSSVRKPISAGIKTTLVYYLAFITLGLTTASLGPTLDALAAQTSARIDQISLLFAVRSFGYLLGAIAAGRLYDRLRGHPLMAAALLVMAAGMTLIPGMPLLWLLFLILLVVGAGEGLLDVGGNTLIVWLHAKQVGPFMNGLHFCFGLGALLAPIIVAQVVRQTGGIGWAYGLIALTVLPTMIGVLRSSSPKNSQVESTQENGASRPLGLGLIALLVLFFVLYVGAEVSYGGWIYLYATSAAGMDPETAAYTTSGFWGAFTIGRLVSIPIAARLRPKTILQLDFSGALVSLGILLLWPDQVWGIWIASIGFGLSIASVFPTMVTFAGSRIPITARVTGYFFVGATIGGMLLPWLVGQYFESAGPGFLTQSLIVDLVLAIMILFALNIAFRRRAAGRA